MKKLFIGLSVLLALLCSGANVAAQATTEVEVDLAAASEASLAADPEALVEGLQERPEDDLLPEGFSNPSSGTPENQDLVAQFEGGLGTIEGAVGQATVGFDTDPEVVPGVVSSGILTFIVIDEEIDADTMAEYQSGMEDAVADFDSSMTGTVETVDLYDGEAVVLTISVEASGSYALVQVVSIPVGNTLVVSTVVSADQAEIDPADLQGPTEALLGAGVNQVQAVAEGL